MDKNLSNRQIINQSNELINARYELSPLQKKLILLAIAQIDPICDSTFFQYTTTINEIEQKLNEKINYTRFRDDCIDLFKKPLYFRNTNTKSRKKWIVCSWFSSIIYDEGRVTFKIADDLLPYLINFKEKFTQYELKDALNLKGKYSIRFFEWLKQTQNQSNKKRTFILNDLYELLELPPTLRIFKDFRIKVLEPSIKEINERTNIKARYEFKKLGRKINEITLIWDFAEVLEAKTSPAREVKSLAKYIGKTCLFFSHLIKIEKVLHNKEAKRFEVIYLDDDKEYSRVDFNSLDALDLAIQRAKNEIKERQKNPEQYERHDRSAEMANLFKKAFGK